MPISQVGVKAGICLTLIFHYAPRAIRLAWRTNAVEDEEKIILAGRPDANMPALLTKDVLGG